jgi:PilZ domain
MRETPERSSAAAVARALSLLPGRRLHHRQRVPGLAYVNLDGTDNGGIIRDLSESGMAIQAVNPLLLNQQVRLRFDLPRPRVHIETQGRVAWADSAGQAGVHFLSLPERPRRTIKEWIFTQLLARAHHASKTGSVFFASQPDGGAAELLFSASPHPPIRLEVPEDSGPQIAGWEDSLPALQFRWCPFPISPRSLGRLVDGLILFSAVLLFSVVAMLVTQFFPGWLIAVPLMLGVAGVFVGLYGFLFVAWIGLTPGAYLAQLASLEAQQDATGNATESRREDQPRFR